jgi:hypothetical protein
MALFCYGARLCCQQHPPGSSGSMSPQHANQSEYALRFYSWPKVPTCARQQVVL